ncbi:NucA/NucB deoxyribonuclease domain-containing protein [Streptomyces sp. BH097]|uniref:NucA/NucB deoxyribonuclease domain-containing protein n=1 Tax=unclassified Streptomyces TaxID=2593676 RepID=UPI003BB514AD
MRKRQRGSMVSRRTRMLAGTVLGLLLLGAVTAPPAAAASPGPSGKTEVRAKIRVLDDLPASSFTAPGVHDDGLSAPPAKKFFARDSSEGSDPGTLADPPIPSPSQSITPEECFGHDSSFSGRGWAKGRFASCQGKRLWVQKVDCLIGSWFCSVVGNAYADMAVIHYTKNDSDFRDILEVTYVGNWRVVGDVSGVPLTIRSTCDVTSGGGSCTRDNGGTTRSVDSWAAKGTSFEYANFAQNGGSAPNVLATADLRWVATVVSDIGPSTQRSDPSQARCDRASYLLRSGAGQGCVFPWAPTPTWTVNKSQSPQAAQNIWEAQNNPNATKPPSSRLKAIPAVLHRTANATEIRRHRGVAGRACVSSFPGQYPAPDTDCDEYPMASTQEGSVNKAGGVRDYVVKPINRTDNQDAGRDLNRFYAAQRIMGSDGWNDAFQVRVP